MPILVVLSRIDGNPVAWRCSGCRYIFTAVSGKTADEKRKQLAAEFRVHVRQDHSSEEKLKEQPA